MTRLSGRRRAVAVIGAATVLATLVGIGGVAAADVPLGPLAPAQGSTDPGPLGDAFYTPPDPIPDGEPGDVIRARRTGPNSWLVMYRSTDALGNPDAVTGTVLTPPGVRDLSDVPIVGFGVGTQGPAFRCAASKALQAGLLYEQSAVNEMVKAGYAVAVTDYEGYSADTRPTYITGRSEGPAMLDAVRAATRLPEAGIGEGGHQVALQGYSQGGGASMWAAQMAPTYAPDLDLVGAVGGGVPADLEATAKLLDGGVGFGFLAFAALGLDSAYPELDLDSYLNDRGRTTLNAAAKTDCLPELLAKYPFQRISDYTTSNPLDTPAWKARLDENQLGATPPQVPVFQYHALADEIVPFPQADALHRKYCAAGVDLTWKVYPLSEHAAGIFAGLGDAKSWIADRFAGKPATTSC